MYFVSLAIMFVVTMAAMASVFLLGNLAHKFFVKVLARQLTGSDSSEIVFDSIVAGVSRFPMIIASVLLAIGTGSCGTMSLVFGTFIQFLHISKMYKDHVEKIVKKTLGLVPKDKPLDFDLGPLNFQLALGLLWMMTTLLNVPSLLAWTFGNSMLLQPLTKDHSYLVSVILCLSLPVLWNERKPSKFKKHYQPLAFGLQFCSILIMLYGLISAYRINYFVTAAVTMLFLHQLLAPSDPDKTFITGEETAAATTTTTTPNVTDNNHAEPDANSVDENVDQPAEQVKTEEEEEEEEEATN